MQFQATGQRRGLSLLDEYSITLSEALLRNRTRVAEQTARAEAEIATRVKSEFIANMSHELRTPLNTVIGFSKMLNEHGARKLSDADIVEFSGMIRESASRLLGIINDILDISKLQAGHYRLDARDIELDEFLTSIVANLQKEAEAAEVRLSHTIACDGASMRGEPAKLRQALVNVIGNAVKFTRKSGSVDVRLTRDDGDRLVVTISDTGIGMSAEEIAAALVPFGQADGGRTRWREGVGLGLPIAKALIELHGGEITIASKLGLGTEVTIRLPMATNADSGIADPFDWREP